MVEKGRSWTGSRQEQGKDQEEEDKEGRIERRRRRTISVASTLVPTILSLTFVFFSMICGWGSVSESCVGAERERDETDLFVRGVRGGGSSLGRISCRGG